MENKPRKLRKIILIILISLAAAILIAAAVFFMWYKGVFLPGWIKWQSRDMTISENQGTVEPPSRIELKSRRIRVYDREGNQVWESGDKVLVSDFLYGDIDHDGEDELMLLCWRIGRYGRVVPLFDQEEFAWSQHIYIYDWTEEGIHAIWMASDIGIDAADWSFSEDERLSITEASGNISHWDWLNWGLESID